VSDIERRLILFPLKAKVQFSDRVLKAFNAAKIIGVRAGKAPHRFIGVWVVVVKDRVFVRPWNNKPEGWYQTFLKEPEGRIQVVIVDISYSSALDHPAFQFPSKRLQKQ
jgi:hypothetical protein